jgi:putative DNA primase/helicase
VIDLAQAELFIAFLTGSATAPVALQLADDRGDKFGPKRREFSRVLYGSVRQHHALLSRFNAAGGAVWVQINEGRRGAQGVTGLRALFIEDDGKSPEPPRFGGPQPHLIVQSSTERKRHYYFKLRAGEAIEKFTPAQKHLALRFGTDKSINNLDRVMRLPGSMHMKDPTRPLPVRILHVDPNLPLYTIDELLAAYPISEAIKQKLLAEPQPEVFTDAAQAMMARIKGWLVSRSRKFVDVSPVRIRLERCPFNPTHGDKMMIAVQGRGGVWAGCWHESCGNNQNRWLQVKDTIGGWLVGAPGFTRGDETEIARRMLADLGAASEEPLVYADGDLRAYSRETGLWEKVPPEAQTQVIVGYAGLATGPKKVLHVNRGNTNGAIALAAHIAAKREFFHEAAPGIAFANGFLAVTPAGSAFMEHSPDHRQIVGLPFSYEPNARAPRFLRFLLECFLGDDDVGGKIALLQEFLGACLVGVATRYERALMLHGEGRNGKSTFTKIAHALFPKTMCASIRPQDFGNDYHRAALAGIRLNVVSEIPENDILSTDAFKGIVSGDPMDARKPYGEVFNHRPQAGHIFAANRLPGTNDHSLGFWRRWIIVTWNREFVGESSDETLAEYIISTEMAGVASWAAQGAERLLDQRRYTEPPSSIAAVQRWRIEVDQVAAFTEEAIDRDSGESEIAFELLYETFRDWLERHGHRAMSSNAFARRLRACGLQGNRRNDGTYYAIRLRIPIPIRAALPN